jgi:effector-binding domain-containing protein
VIGDVVELTVGARPTAVIAETTSWDAFPQLWRALLGEVWDEVRGSAEVRPGRNVMLYLDDVPHVEIGVEAAAGPFGSLGRVVPSALPGGRVAMTRLVGGYDEIGAAHEAVVAACAERGLERLGPRWEIYGHHNDASPDQEVEIYHLVAPQSSSGG